MTDYISAELAATCAALGYYDGQKYHLDKYCLDVIKDLIKYLKRDNDIHTIRRFLGQTKLLQTDLIKIFVQHSDKLELWDVLLRLIINLTSPASLIYNEQIPTEKTSHSYYLQIISHLQSYKVALADDNIWATVSRRLSAILDIDASERGEQNEMIIERILAFIKNVLQVPPDENEKRTDNDATIHDQILFTLHASGVVDILLFIASSSAEQQYHMQILEIVSLILRDQSASQLATSGLQRSRMEKEKDEAELLAVRKKEKLDKIEKWKKYAGARHSRFGGTYVVQNMKAIGDNQMICHKPYEKAEALEFNVQRTKVKKPKNKAAMLDARGERISALSVRLFLKEFCVEFLNGAYNPVMRYARSCIIGDVQSDARESTCYLWALRFFMEFNRHYKFQVKYVSETISTEIFYLVQRQLVQYYEILIMDKKKEAVWSRRLHVALQAYQELLHTLMAMDKSPDQSVRESSKVIKSNVFYVPEYREMIYFQLLYYDEVKMPRKYLIDLVTTAHVFLKLLEQFCAKGQRSLIVQKVRKRRHKSGKRKHAIEKEEQAMASLEDRWDDLAPELSAIMQPTFSLPEMVPFDATLDTPIDDQKSDAMKKIQRFLRMRLLENAVGLLRAAREVWPENDCFGRADIPLEEEFLALREIFFADLGVNEEECRERETSAAGDNVANASSDEKEYADEEEGEEEGASIVIEETDFKFNEFIQKFANVQIVKTLASLLRDFDKNSKEVNHYVTKMLHRIAWDCKMSAMMFQASIFRTFQRIFDSTDPAHEELQKFAVFVFRRFVETAQKNGKAYMELLFWKHSSEAAQVVDGYDSQTGKKKIPSRGWSEQEEEELRTLFMEHQTNKYPEDLVNWILTRLVNENRTRRSVMKKLKEMCLIVNSKAVRKEIQRRLPKEWSEEEMAQLTALWRDLTEASNETHDPIDLIYNELQVTRPKAQIRQKLLELGLAKNRKELYKKRLTKGKSSWETQSASNSDEDRDSDEETTKSSERSSVAAPSKPLKKGTSRQTKKRVREGKKETSRKQQPSLFYTDAQLSGLLKDVIDRNMTEALEWLRESLEDAVEDRDEENSEGIPLVPLTDHSSAAMDSPSFQKLLRAMGIEAPVDEQQVYWRIPAHMLSSTIEKRCALLADSLQGKFPPEETEAPTPWNTYDTDESEHDVDVFENIKKLFVFREEGAQVTTWEEAQSSSRKMREKVEEEPQPVGQEGSHFVKGKSRLKLKTLVDSSASETEADDQNKRSRDDVSDSENLARKRARLLDSDDDEFELERTGIGISTSQVAASDNNEIRKEGFGEAIDSEERESACRRKRRPRLLRTIISDDEEQ